MIMSRLFVTGLGVLLHGLSDGTKCIHDSNYCQVNASSRRLGGAGNTFANVLLCACLLCCQTLCLGILCAVFLFWTAEALQKLNASPARQRAGAFYVSIDSLSHLVVVLHVVPKMDFCVLAIWNTRMKLFLVRYVLLLLHQL